MCKILCMTSHDPAKRDEIINKVWKAMEPGNNDGFGAAWQSPDGQIGYYKRSHSKITEPVLPDFVKKKKSYGHEKKPFAESNDIPSDGGFLIIHARNATGAVNVANTHPMLAENAALVHNGVVHSTKHKNLVEGCTCDSELLLNAYLEGGIEELENDIAGYYAFMLILTDNENKKTLHIAKDGRAMLEYGVCEDKTSVFATTEHLLTIVGAEHMGEVENDRLIIFEDKIVCHAYPFAPQGYIAKTQKEKEDVNKSLGGSEDSRYNNYWQKQHDTQQNRKVYPETSIDTAQWDADSKEIERLEMEAIIEDTQKGV